MESKGTIFRSKLSHVVHDFVVCGWSGRWQSGCALHSQLWQLPAMRKESADDMWGTPFWSCWCVKIPSLGDAPWESMRYIEIPNSIFLQAFLLFLAGARTARLHNAWRLRRVCSYSPCRSKCELDASKGKLSASAVSVAVSISTATLPHIHNELMQGVVPSSSSIGLSYDYSLPSSRLASVWLVRSKVSWGFWWLASNNRQY